MAKSIKKLKQSTANKKKYLSYYEKMKKIGKTPLSYGNWKGSNQYTRSQMSVLQNAGFSNQQINKRRRK